MLRKDNAHLLYAALELRFALERMIASELLFASKATERSLKEYDPVKKLRALHRLNDATRHYHKIVIVNRRTGERFEWGQYKPLDPDRVASIHGRLGDLLDPKVGLSLGVRNDTWYIETRQFLRKSCDYLDSVRKGNSHFFGFEGLDHIEMVKVEPSEDSPDGQR